ncbi:POC1 centriolar protein homolog A isoform X1 [Achroia grisella]|uniref:POC1 centriolar protein homolog A isoform X1 n=1 Tax=Achroia grisella TaxID=688607 RepID=UPI0027D32EEF|nr:POC1 centriolar protein homolog A isoform X1 [Achroia grisella]
MENQIENKITHLEPFLEKQLKGHRNAITAVFFNPNEKQIASSSLDNSILLWDLRGTMRSYRFQGHDEAVLDVTFSPSGKYMASASRDKTVRLWVPTVIGSTGVFKAHSQTVRSVQFSPDGSKIITASDDKIVKLWATEKHKFIASFVGHTNWVRCARMSGDGSVIASCSDDKTTRLWSPDTGECIHTYKDQNGYGGCVAWHPSGCYIAVATSLGNVKLYDTRTHNLVQYYSIHNEAVTNLAFHPSGSYILTASKDGKMKILDLLEGHPIFTLSGHSGAVAAVSFSPSGDSFASAGDDKLVFLWETNFTQLYNEVKENIPHNQSSVPRSTSHMSKLTSTTKGGNQGKIKAWYKCYHTIKYPVTTFVHLDDVPEPEKESDFQEPNANSTLVEPNENSPSNMNSQRTAITSTQSTRFAPNSPPLTESQVEHSYNVGHISHIPRTPPSPATYTIPSIISKSTGTIQDYDDGMFGMIKLKENDVCYTSGTIEWVGKKRSFPINSGFKILNEMDRQTTEPHIKKSKRLDKIFNNGTDKIKQCECADVLPTVNAIVDHLNALHEAVDLVDLRLNTLEDVMSKD